MAITVSEVLIDECTSLSIGISPTRVEKLLVGTGLTPTDPYTESTAKATNEVLIRELSRLLAMPDVTEGGMSLKWDRSAVSTYLDQLRAQWGLVVSSGPTLTDRSNLW